MDSFKFNKIAGAVLGTCLVGMGIGLVGQAIFFPPPPKKPGYALSEPNGPGGAKKPAEVPLPMLLAKANPKKGENDAKVCSACHNFAEGAGAKVGPDLYGVVDRSKGSVQGFDYSAGMKAKGGKWTFADLNEFITKPAAYVKGTKMGFQGEQDAQKRADVIAYLDTLAKSPVPLPKPTEADKKAAEGGGKEAAAGGGDDQLIKMVAAANPKKGESDAKICSACHNFKEGGGTLVGPDLYGVVDRPKGSVQGFDYSAGMKAKGGKWTFADLNEFITKPAAYVKGTKMGFPGEADAKKRAEIIAFLRTLAKTPAPLPKGGEGAKKADAGGAAGSAENGKEAAGGEDIVKMVAAANPNKGKSVAQICSACHNFKEGGGALVGPDLYGVVDRAKGSVQGFDYSAGMKAKGGKWTYADLNEFITKPTAYVKGTKMGFPGEADAKKRAEIIAFLRTLAKTPAPLPGAKPEPAAAKAGAPPAPPAPAAKPAEEAKSPAPAAKPAEEAKSPAPAAKPGEETKPPAPAAKPEEAKPPAPAAKPAEGSSGKADESGPEPYSAADPQDAPR